MAAISRWTRRILLEDLPPRLLRRIVDRCADDLTHGRTTLLSLSVMNRYFRSLTVSRVFKHISFHDSSHSTGDEILHSIRQFMKFPELWCHARTVSLSMNRISCLGAGHTTRTDPYHCLVLPELFKALVTMSEVTELSIHTYGRQGKRCLQGLQAAVRWCAAGKELNIRSLTISPDNGVGFKCSCEESDNEIDFLAALPELKTFCLEGTTRYGPVLVMRAGNYYHPTIASNLTQLRFYKTRSDPRTAFDPDGWRGEDIPELNLRKVTPELKYLSILGELRGILVSRLLRQLTDLPKLKYVDITDEQMLDSCLWHYDGSLAYIQRRACADRRNEDRSEVARQTVATFTELRRICFVRALVGEVYLRGHHYAVADSTGYISHELNDADRAEVPAAWRYGVPQTSSLPFPTFTPWEGLGQPLKRNMAPPSHEVEDLLWGTEAWSDEG